MRSPENDLSTTHSLQPPLRGDVRVEKNGVTYRASWRVEKAALIVDYSDSSRCVQYILPLNERPPAGLAMSVLCEIVDDLTGRRANARPADPLAGDQK